MKLKDLPLRDWIALEALSGVLASGNVHPADTVDRAYKVSDAMLAKMDTYQCRIATAEDRAAKAEKALEDMRAYKFDVPDFAARIALSEVWAALGVGDQTAAMQKLRQLLA